MIQPLLKFATNNIDNAIGIGVRKFVKPNNLTGLTYSTKPIGDICRFQTDRTFCPQVLERFTKCKDLDELKEVMLKMMGYKKPELVNIEKLQKSSYSMSFDYEKGLVGINENVLSTLDKYKKIALLRHELDHMDKCAKLVKVYGIDVFEKTLMKSLKKAGIPPSGLNRKFWEEISKDANIEGFNAPKYLNALENYPWKAFHNAQTKSANSYQYLNFINEYVLNPLEDSAYKIQSKVLKEYNQSPTSFYDSIGLEFNKIKNLLQNNSNKENLFQSLYEYSTLFQTKEGQNLLIEYVKNHPLSEKHKQLRIKLLTTMINDDEQLAIMKTVTSWLKEGRYSLEDILPTIIT